MILNLVSRRAIEFLVERHAALHAVMPSSSLGDVLGVLEGDLAHDAADSRTTKLTYTRPSPVGTVRTVVRRHRLTPPTGDVLVRFGFGILAARLGADVQHGLFDGNIADAVEVDVGDNDAVSAALGKARTFPRIGRPVRAAPETCGCPRLSLASFRSSH